MEADRARQLDWLVNLEQIRSVISRYALAGDRKNDPEVMRRIFAEDGIWEAEGFGRFEGRETIASELARIGQEQILWSLHFPVSPIVEVADDGRSAHAHWWLWELLTIREDGVDTDRWLGATYACDFVREPDAWKMKHLVLRIEKMVELPPEAGAPVVRAADAQ